MRHSCNHLYDFSHIAVFQIGMPRVQIGLLKTKPKCKVHSIHPDSEQGRFLRNFLFFHQEVCRRRMTVGGSRQVSGVCGSSRSLLSPLAGNATFI